MTQPLLPDLPGFSIEQIIIAHGVITVLACSQTTSGHCPGCSHLSSRIHSRYQRTLADLPWSGRTVRLVVQVQRFFCTHPTCLRKTFTEAIPAVAERYARRTNRLKAALERLGLTLGGEPASRLAAVLAMGCSPDTVLRLLRRLPDEPPYQLTVNCRTTRRIHDQVLHFYRQSEGALPPVAYGPEGRPVEWRTYDGRKASLQQALLSLLHELIEDEHVSASEIAVLTPFSQRTSQLKAESLHPSQEITLRWSAETEGTNQVRLETIYSFKGLERPVVILTEVER